ncbi:MAG: hypothetical protein WCF68_03600 [Terriglobales bacterium]
MPVRVSSPFVIFLVAFACLSGSWCAAQSASDDGAIRGVVLNSVTHEPIDRALVSSPDNRFATLTNSEGRFEFSVPKADDSGSDSNSSSRRRSGLNRPSSLMARKPGFLGDSGSQGNGFLSVPGKELTLALTPEAVIAGTVALPTAEAPESITLQLFRSQIQDGRARWVPAGNSRSMSDGSFRFADLPAGTYKLLTTELLDTDPATSDPHVDPLTSETRAPVFGYPPVYFESSPDFGSASSIQLSAGQTQTANLTLAKQSYYRVKVPVIIPGTDQSTNGLSVAVYTGRKGPGYALGYNVLHRAVEGLLPNGTYTVEVTSFRPAETGVQTITVKGGPVDGPSIVLAPNGSIPVYVKEDFTSNERGGLSASRGPRHYLNVALEPADDFGTGHNVSLRSPNGPGDEALVIEGAPAGSYWVRVQTALGYAASVRSGNLDLQHQPLVVGVGGAVSPIEITMRDDTAEISGTVDGVGVSTATQGADSSTGQSRAHVYCIPLAESSGQFAEMEVQADGSFDFQGLAPGGYRVLAFDRAQTEIEYRNPEAVQAFDSKGSVVRVTGGQKERVTLALIATESY